MPDAPDTSPLSESIGLWCLMKLLPCLLQTHLKPLTQNLHGLSAFHYYRGQAISMPTLSY